MHWPGMGPTKSYQRQKGQLSAQMMWGRLKNILVLRYLRRYSSESRILVTWVVSSGVGALVPLLPSTSTQCVLRKMCHLPTTWGSFSHHSILFLAGSQKQTLSLLSYSPCPHYSFFWWEQYRVTSLQVPPHLPPTHTHTHFNGNTMTT